MNRLINRQLAIASDQVKPIAHYFWQLSAHDLIHLPDYLIPNGSLHLVFVLNNHFYFNDLTGKPQAIRKGAYFFGHHSKAFEVFPDKGFEMFAMKFNSQGLHHFLRLPLSDFDEQHCLSAEAVFSKSLVKEIEEKLSATHCFQTRVKLTEEVIKRRILMQKEEDRLISAAQGIVHAMNGQLAVREIANRLFVSEKTLSRKFLEKLGLPPKTYIKNIRFECAYKHLMYGRFSDLMDIAMANGYYDRNHLIKDFQFYLQMPPSKVVASGITNREDLLSKQREH